MNLCQWCKYKNDPGFCYPCQYEQEVEQMDCFTCHTEMKCYNDVNDEALRIDWYKCPKCGSRAEVEYGDHGRYKTKVTWIRQFPIGSYKEILMENKYTIEITKDKSVLTLLIDGHSFSQTWVRKPFGYQSTKSIVDQVVEKIPEEEVGFIYSDLLQEIDDANMFITNIMSEIGGEDF